MPSIVQRVMCALFPVDLQYKKRRTLQPDASLESKNPAFNGISIKRLNGVLDYFT